MYEKLNNVIVLGGDMPTPAGQLGPITKARLDMGIKIFQESQADALTLTGSYPFHQTGPKPTQPCNTFMKKAALEQGVPERAIWCVDSLDTIGDLLHTAQIYAERGVAAGEITIVTSASHLPRSLKIAQHIFANRPGLAIRGQAVPEKIGLQQQVHERMGALLMRAVLNGTKPGDLPAIERRLRAMVPHYDEQFSKGQCYRNILKGILHLPLGRLAQPAFAK